MTASDQRGAQSMAVIPLDATSDDPPEDTWARAVADGAVLLTVNQRLSRHFLERYERWRSRRDDTWWETPQILPLSSWLDSLHEHALLDGHVDRAVMPPLIEQQAWRRCLESDSQLSALLDIEAAARQACTAWQLARSWHLSMDKEATASADQQAFARWAMRFRRHCEASRQIDSATAMDAVVERIGQGALATVLPAQVLIAGFLRITPQLQVLFDALAGSGVAIARLAGSGNATITRIAWSDDSSELIGIARQVRQCLEQKPTAELGVVIANLGRRRRQVLRAFDQVFFPGLDPAAIERSGRPYDFSLGGSLIEEPVAHAAWLGMKLALGELQGAEVSAWLLSPYAAETGGEADLREQLDRRLRDRPAAGITPKALRASLPGSSLLARALRKLERQRTPRKATATTWASVLGDVLTTLGWPGSTSTRDYQAAQSVHGCLDDLQRLDDGRAMNAHAALAQIHRLLVDRIFQPETPSVPVQILGRLESHGIRFDRLWITGLDSEQWPPVSQPTALLSIQQQRQAGVPEASAETRLALARDEWSLWCTSAARVDASHALSREGNALMPAAIIADEFLADDKASLASTAVSPPWQPPAQLIAAGTELESTPDLHGPALEAGSEVRGGAKLLENQALCPFKAFATHRLAIRPLEEPAPGLDRRQQGTLLHRVLELFWQRVETHDALVALYASNEIDQVLHETIGAAVKEQQIAEPLQSLEQARLARLVSEWLARRELPREPFSVVAFEAERSVDREGVCMNLKVDRVDQLASGETIVVDYKTGTLNSTKSWAEPRIESPQLPLYALTDEAIEGVYFAEVVRHRPRFLGQASDAGLLDTGRTPKPAFETWAEWRAHWQSALDGVAREIRQGLASVTPSASACTFCELPPLCRIDPEVRRAGVDADADERTAIPSGEPS